MDKKKLNNVLVRECRKIDLNGIKVALRIINNSRVKNIKITIYTDKILVSKSKNISKIYVERILKTNKEKIYKKYIDILEKNNFNEKENYRSIMYKGERFEIVIINKFNITKPKMEIDKINKQFKFYINGNLNNEEINKLLEDKLLSFFKEDTYSFVKQKINYWSNIIGVTPNNINVKYVRSRWGSCVKETKNLNFNILLSKLKEEVAESIVIHEMCHLIESNHSKYFWNIVNKYCPNYNECKMWIKQNIKNTNIL